MAEFSIDLSSVAKISKQEDNVAEVIANVIKELDSIKDSLPMNDSSFVKIKSKIDSLIVSTKKHQLKVKELSGALEQIIRLYQKAENNIISGASKFQKIIEEIKQHVEDILEIIGRIAAGFFDYTSCYDGDPVNMCTGNYVDSIIELSFGKHMYLQFTRNYNSIYRTVGCMGPGWSHNYEIFLDVYDNRVVLTMGDGTAEEFVSLDGIRFISKFGNYSFIEKSEEGFVFADKASHKMMFDLTGVLLAIQDTNNNSIQFEYVDQRLIKAFDNFENSLSFEYGETGNLVCVKDSADRVVYFEYESGLLTKCTNVDDASTEYLYDDRARLVSWINPDGNKLIEMTYDAQNRVVKQVMANDATMLYEYNDKEVIYTDPNGVKKTYIHDDRNRHIATVIGDHMSKYVYNDKNERIEYTDMEGNIYKREFDQDGNIVKFWSPMNEETKFNFENGRITAIVAPNGTITKRLYDERGNVVQYIDEIGCVTSMEYDKHGNLICVTNPDGSFFSYEYDSKCNLVRFTDCMGISICFEYDKAGRVIKAIDAMKNETSYTYTASNKVASITNANNEVKTIEYSKTGKVCRIVDFDGTEEKIVYDAMGRPEVYIDKAGRTTKRSFDLMSNTSEVYYPDGTSVEYKYNSLNLVTEVKRVNGVVDTFEYDANGQVTKTNKNGKVTQYIYDQNKRVKKVIDEDEKEFEYNEIGKIKKAYFNGRLKYEPVYDSKGRIIEKIYDGKTYEKYEYSSVDELVKLTDARGAEKHYEYYPGGRIKKVVFGDGREINYTYDGNGNLASKANGNGYIVSYTYDALSRKTGIQDNEGKSLRYIRNTTGKVVSRIDSNNNETVYGYSTAGKINYIKDAANNETKYYYDINENLQGIMSYGDQGQSIEAMGHCSLEELVFKNDRNISGYMMEHNDRGQIISVADCVGNKKLYDYNESGKIIKSVNEIGEAVSYHYDEAGRMLAVCSNDKDIIRFKYDGKNISHVSNSTHSIHFSYAEDRISSVTDSYGNTLKYSWSDDGLCTEIVYPNDISLKKEYDEFSRVTMVSYNGKEIRFEYNDCGFIDKKIYPNNTEMRYTYYPSGRYKVLAYYGQDNKLIYSNQYEYDGDGNIISVQKNSDAGNHKYDYIYDSNNRLAVVREDGVIQTSFEYDRFGNRVKKTTADCEVQYQYNKLQQLVSEITNRQGAVSTKTYEYNQAGRLVATVCEGNVNKYEYDCMDRLIRITDNLGNIKEFVRDGLGNCIETKVIKNGIVSSTKHVLDYSKQKNNIVADITDDSTNYFVWEQGLCAVSQNDTMQYVSCDEKGSIKSYTDETGSVVSMHDYDEFGVDIMSTLSNDKPFGYCSFYYDTQMESYITPTRIYNPSIGRFDSRDKIDYIHVENPSSINLYAYCLNNPIMYVDYNGTDCYVYYLPEWEDEAENDREQLMEQYGLGADQVHLVPVTSNDSLTTAWNAMGTENGETVDIDCVVINTHANPYGLGYGDNSDDFFTAADVSNMDDKDVGALVLYGCNAGHADHADDNIASAFSEKVNDAPVIASDGTVSNQTGGAHSYKSKDDSTFRKYCDGIYTDSWAPINWIVNWATCRDNYGWLIYQNGELVPDYDLGRKMNITEMIEYLRENDYICSLNQ